MVSKRSDVLASFRTGYMEGGRGGCLGVLKRARGSRAGLGFFLGEDSDGRFFRKGGRVEGYGRIE